MKDASTEQRVDDEAEYVLTVLLRMRDAASASPELYDPDARKQIDEAIARLADVRRKAESIVRSAEQDLDAA